MVLDALGRRPIFVQFLPTKKTSKKVFVIIGPSAFIFAGAVCQDWPQTTSHGASISKAGST
jgi:hypothetical protein